MIRKVAYKDIDFAKYQECILNSFNYKIYAENWYLDAVTEKKWNCFVYGDYEFVMPLPFVKRLGLRLISMPILCQQLGVFGKQEDIKIFDLFVTELTKLKVEVYNFNDSNVFSDENLKINSKINQILDISDDYEEIYSNFKKDRKKDIRRIEKFENIEISKEFSFSQLTNELIEKYPLFEKSIYSTSSFKNLITEFEKRNSYQFYSLNVNGKTISTIFLIQTKETIILLLSSRDTSGEYKGAFAYLVNQIIKDNKNKLLILDFEGSSIPSINSFNESFGALVKEYYTFSNFKVYSKIKFLKNFISRK